MEGPGWTGGTVPAPAAAAVIVLGPERCHPVLRAGLGCRISDRGAVCGQDGAHADLRDHVACRLCSRRPFVLKRMAVPSAADGGLNLEAQAEFLEEDV
jgi:hypothetical protein